MSGEQFASRIRTVLVILGLFIAFAALAVLTSEWVDNLLLGIVSLWKDKPPGPAWLPVLRFFSVQVLSIGLLLAVFGWLIGLRWHIAVRLGENQIIFTIVVLLAALWLPVILLGRSETIDGVRYWWLYDDAMVSMRYARNLVEGNGLVWNPGDRVEGYSNFLWTIYMAIIHWLRVPETLTSLVVLLTNVLIGAVTVPVIFYLMRLLGGGMLAALGTSVAYVLSLDIMYWATYGMETAILTLLFLWGMYRVLREAQRDQPRLLTYVLIVTMALVRADGLFLSVLLYALAIFLNRSRKKVFTYIAASLLLSVAQEVFRIIYYGDVLPNTAYLKTTNWDGRLSTGLNYGFDFVRAYAVPIAFAVAGLILSRQSTRHPVFLVLLLYGAYVVYVGGDAFPGFRFFLPVIPILMGLAFIGIQDLSLGQAPRLAFSFLCLLLIPLTIPSADLIAPDARYVGNVKIALWLNQNTPASSKVADFWAGMVFYYSNRHGIDLLGKSDPYIAHLPPASSSTKPGHNKFDFNYSLGVLKPDYVIANFRVPVDEEQMRQVSTGDWAHTGQLYFHPLFREHCMPNPVSLETWRTVFHCDWSKP